MFGARSRRLAAFCDRAVAVLRQWQKYLQRRSARTQLPAGAMPLNFVWTAHMAGGRCIADTSAERVTAYQRRVRRSATGGKSHSDAVAAKRIGTAVSSSHNHHLPCCSRTCGSYGRGSVIKPGPQSQHLGALRVASVRASPYGARPAQGRPNRRHDGCLDVGDRWGQGGLNYRQDA